MADNYTQFAVEIRNVTNGEMSWIKNTIQGAIECMEKDIEDPAEAGFSAAVIDLVLEGMIGFEWEEDGDTVYMYSMDHGEPNSTAAFLCHFLKKFRPNEYIFLEYAYTCSKPRSGEFGGGAVFITADGCKWNSSHSFLNENLKEFMKNNPEVSAANAF